MVIGTTDVPAPCVTPDERAPMRHLMQSILALDHRKIGIVPGQLRSIRRPCEFPALGSHFVVGVKAPLQRLEFSLIG